MTYKDTTYTILGKKIKVKFVPVVIYEGSAVEGVYLPHEALINVSVQGRPKQEVKQTLLHELGHAIIHRSGIYTAALSHDLQELIVDNYATVLTEIFDFEI